MKSFAPVPSNNTRAMSPTLPLFLWAWFAIWKIKCTKQVWFLFCFGSRQNTFSNSVVISVKVLARVIKAVMFLICSEIELKKTQSFHWCLGMPLRWAPASQIIAVLDLTIPALYLSCYQWQTDSLQSYTMFSWTQCFSRCFAGQIPSSTTLAMTKSGFMK